jgi:hypothetical protein
MHNFAVYTKGVFLGLFLLVWLPGSETEPGQFSPIAEDLKKMDSTQRKKFYVI